MYKTYITEALVCGSKQRNTYDRVFLLFTREAGMVWANARSVRKERSKQRYALQDFSHIRASLVSGKAGWRIAGVEPLDNFYFIAATREARALVRNIVRLLRRTIHGEDAHPDIFDDLIASLSICNDARQKELEVLLSLRVLHRLGYISPDEQYDQVLRAATAHTHLGTLTGAQIRTCQQAIEHALLSSQL